MYVKAIGGKLSAAVAESIYDNAVVVKEFRTRMRGWKAFAIMGGYILLLCLVMGKALGEASGYRMVSYANHQVGMDLFAALAITQVVLLTLVLPSLTAGSITGEVEKRTIEMLALSNLTAGKIVLGKHLSGFLYAIVLLVCSIPLAGLCLMFGGISPGEIAVSYCIIAAWAFMFTSAGVLWSALFRRTAAATLCSYGTCVGYMLLTIPLGAISLAVQRGNGDASVFGAMNPAFAPYLSMLSANVCGTNVSVALITGVMMVLAGWLMMIIAMGHVRYQQSDRPLSVRLLVLTISGLSTFLIAGNTSFAIALGMLMGPWKIVFLVFSIILIVVLALAVPAFATGRITGYKGPSLLYGLSPFKMFKSDLGGSAAFVMLWTLVTYGGMWLGLKLLAGSGFMSGAMTFDAKFFAECWHNGFAMLFVMLGFCAVGILFSAMVSTRRAAAGLTVLFVFIMLVGYSVMLIGFTGENASPIMQLAPLWPITPVLCENGIWHDSSMPQLYCQGSEWLATSAAYFIITIIALSWAGALHARGRGVKEED